jgi:hypothetical protein
MFLKDLLNELDKQKDNIIIVWDSIPYKDKKKRIKGTSLILKIGDILRKKDNLVVLCKVSIKYNDEVYIYLNNQKEPLDNNKFQQIKYDLYNWFKNYMMQNINNFIFKEQSPSQELEQYIPSNIEKDIDKKTFWRTIFKQKQNSN